MLLGWPWWEPVGKLRHGALPKGRQPLLLLLQGQGEPRGSARWHRPHVPEARSWARLPHCPIGPSPIGLRSRCPTPRCSCSLGPYPGFPCPKCSPRVPVLLILGIPVPGASLTSRCPCANSPCPQVSLFQVSQLSLSPCVSVPGVTHSSVPVPDDRGVLCVLASEIPVPGVPICKCPCFQCPSCLQVSLTQVTQVSLFPYIPILLSLSQVCCP